MAVHTPLKHTQLQTFLNDYDLGPLITFKGIAEGIENSNFFLETEHGQFILTLFEKRVRHHDLPYFVGIMKHLVNARFPAAKPIPNSHGQVIGSLANKPCIICSFLPGISLDTPDIDACNCLGNALARLHLALENFKQHRQDNLSINQWTHMFAGLQSSANRLQKGLANSISTDLNTLNSAWPKKLPTATIHADLFPDNALFLNGRLSGVIDFYFACTNMLAYDIAVCINSWCFSNDGARLDTQKTHALIAGYRNQRKLCSAEINALPVLAKGAAMRFFLTRLIDWRQNTNTTQYSNPLVTTKNPLDFARRLDFHRSARSLEDYGL